MILLQNLNHGGRSTASAGRKPQPLHRHHSHLLALTSTALYFELERVPEHAVRQ